MGKSHEKYSVSGPARSTRTGGSLAGVDSAFIILHLLSGMWSLAVSGEGRDTQSALLPARQSSAIGRGVISEPPLDLNLLLSTGRHARIASTVAVGDVVTQPGAHL